MSDRTRLRCAIYTRKSSEEGLEQEFNSLDAQYEACAAYITSQVGLGWKLVSDRYDDGGISGGTMERPALQRLLHDIRDKRIDVVVVYKIDRLTRALMDFARMVEIFDASNVSFVSITQQFNTTTSMGRLTLNVLLSFAQFEREVTAERIRDKIAASKKKGMWMGGAVPFGYRVENRKLIIDEAAAEEVRKLFHRYGELGSVPALVRELNERDHTSLSHDDIGQGRRRAATRVGKGKLYYMLANPIYAGSVRHGNELYPGEHQPIIDNDLFASVQAKLAQQAPYARGTSVTRDIHLLNGLLFDETGDRLGPIHASNHGKRYRYYISSRLKGDRAKKGEGWRIPATEIEAIVLQQLKDMLADSVLLSHWMVAAGQTCRVKAGLETTAQQLDVLQMSGSVSPDHLRAIIAKTIRRIELAKGHMRLFFDTAAITAWLTDASAAGDDVGTMSKVAIGTSRRRRSSASAEPSGAADADLHMIELPFTICHRGVGRRLVIEGQSASMRRLDRPLIDMIARAHAYLEALTDGQGLGRKQVADRFGVHPEDVSRFLPLAFLSPRIVETILTGRQPADLTVRHLARGIDLPISWAAQGRLLTI